ncbi:Hedgehog/Intein (Hint) domain-containing protein [Sphingomonas antarctica]|uniref:hypothetical protein n=1 Tax=Sphingomonas antarctica TaxID=2040274 RepID=UPI0039EAC71A
MTIFAYVLAVAAASAGEKPVELAQLTIRQRIVIRVPATPYADPPRPTLRMRWKEKRGPKCIPMNALAAAAVFKADAVDLMLRGGKRLRALLDDECPAIDYYSGFYIMPSDDGRICAGRDMIHSRAGGKCGIEKFKILEPDK